MTRRLVLAAAAALAATACAPVYESRIRSSLVDAGLSRSVAGCMAERMVDRLSTAQLNDLARATRGSSKRIRDMTLSQFLRHYRAALDPEIYEVLTRAGLGCAIRG